MNRVSLHTRSFMGIHFSAFRYRSTKNGFTDPKSFRCFRETQVELVNICFRIKPDEISLLWNPDFSNPQFFEPHDNSNQKCFPLLGRITVIFSNFTPDFSDSSIFGTNFRIPWGFEKSGFHCKLKFAT